MVVLARHRETEKAENQEPGFAGTNRRGQEWDSVASLRTLVLRPMAGAGGNFPALDMADLPPSSEDNKELSGHL